MKKKEEAKKIDKKLKKTIKKAKKTEKKQLKKLAKKGISKSSDTAKKIKKSFKKVVKKLKKEDKKERKILRNSYSPEHYKSRLVYAEQKMDRMHQLILYLQKELKKSTGKKYDMKKPPKRVQERKKL